ncbi:right-handed parallel beta-helix repeat-containing protein [Candidatus Micrarchaeota archaeon]|nr:right-handed parallel beta-helix repeat-containing protein [Candidatus Micrarchaeota archaeon]
MKKSAVFLASVLFLALGVSFAYHEYNGALYCNTTCADCISALNNGSYSTVYLNSSLSSASGSCINNPTSFSNKVFDCQGNWIYGGTTGYGVYASSRGNVTALNCGINGFRDGVRFRTTSNCLISNFTIFNTTYDGVHLYYFANSTFSNNTVYNNSHEGITFDYSTDSYIENNTIYETAQQCIEIGGSHRNSISYNILHDCVESAIDFHSGVNVPSQNNSILNNTIYNVPDGLTVLNVDSGSPTGNVFFNNTISTISRHGCGSLSYWQWGRDIWMYGDKVGSCNNLFVDNIGSGGLPIYYSNESVSWSNLEASMVFLCNADDSTLTNVTVDSGSEYSNGIIVYYSENVTITDSESSGNAYGFLLHQSENVTIANSTAAGNKLMDFDVGHSIAWDTDPNHCNHVIENLTGSEGYPIYFYNEPVELSGITASEIFLCAAHYSNITNVTLVPSSTIPNNGLYLEHTNYATVSSSTAHGTRYGFFVGEYSNHTNVSGNLAYDNECYSFVAASSEYDNFENNTGHSSLMGFSINVWYNDNLYFGNTAYNNDFQGVYICAWNSVFANNTAYNNKGDGFEMYWADYNIVENNTAYNNGYGFSQPSSIDPWDSTWIGYPAYNGSGFKLYYTTGATMAHNKFYNNLLYQLSLPYSTGTLVYDNILNATDSGIPIYCDSSDNYLNTSLSCGEGNHSIVGGNCSGGNWYSNYTGTDEDDDGIGETNFFAFGMTDYLPLVQALSPSPDEDGGSDAGDYECFTSSDCGDCEACRSHECALPGGACLSDSDCEAGYTCVSCECIAPECTRDSDCGDGHVCKDYECVEVYYEPGCTSASGCGECEECLDGGCVLPGDACLSDSGCTGAGETCVSCECVPPECVYDSDCQEDEECSSYICVSVEEGQSPPQAPEGGTLGGSNKPEGAQEVPGSEGGEGGDGAGEREGQGVLPASSIPDQIYNLLFSAESGRADAGEEGETRLSLSAAGWLFALAIGGAILYLAMKNFLPGSRKAEE